MTLLPLTPGGRVLLALVLVAFSWPAPGVFAAVDLHVDPGGIEYLRVPGGRFVLGCVPQDDACEPHEGPPRTVTLTRDYYVATTPVTVRAFGRFVSDTGFVPSSELGPEGPRGRMYFEDPEHPERSAWRWVAGLSWARPLSPGEPADPAWPVVQVTLRDAEAYCRWAGGHLPTEAQWERAARAGREGDVYVWGRGAPGSPDVTAPLNGPDRRTEQRFPSMETFADYDDGFATLAPVASFPANGYGLFDMAGNVYEYTRSPYADAGYEALAPVDPVGPTSGAIGIVARGGAWGYAPAHQRISWRGYFSADSDFWTATLGFRCVREVAGEREG